MDLTVLQRVAREGLGQHMKVSGVVGHAVDRPLPVVGEG